MKHHAFIILTTFALAFGLMTACGKESIEQPPIYTESPNNAPESIAQEFQTPSSAPSTDIINNETAAPATEATTVATTEATTAPLTQADVEALIAEQEVRVTSTKYVVQDEKYKSLYPDSLQAIITNNSEYDIKDLVVAFAAWDENNLPVLIRGDLDYNDEYIKEAKYTAANLVPGKSVGKDKGYGLDYDIDNIEKFKAIVVSYETFDGDTWENPYYDDWKEVYEGKKLQE